MRIKDLKPDDQIVLEGCNQHAFVTVKNLEPSNLCDWVFINLIEVNTPELLRLKQVLSRENSVWLKQEVSNEASDDN